MIRLIEYVALGVSVAACLYVVVRLIGGFLTMLSGPPATVLRPPPRSPKKEKKPFVLFPNAFKK